MSLLPLVLPRRDAPSSRGARWSRAATTLIAVLVTLGAGLASGVLLTAATIRSDAIGTVKVGPWRVFADAGTPAVNPYTRAREARRGSIPLTAGQGLTATARTTSAGEALDARCSYRLGGTLPSTRFWTLEAADTRGRPFGVPGGRQGFTSADVLRDATGAMTVTLSSQAAPGNWLPLPGTGHVLLILRLYDTDLSRGGGLSASGAAQWPSIEALGCD